MTREQWGPWLKSAVFSHPMVLNNTQGQKPFSEKESKGVNETERADEGEEKKRPKHFPIRKKKNLQGENGPL